MPTNRMNTDNQGKRERQADEHPLDDPLSTIHQISWRLSYYAGRIDDNTLAQTLSMFAMRLGAAHERIEQWALKQMK